MATDYYELLEVSKDASSDELKKAYRRLAMKYHPDRNNADPDAEEKFKEVSNAFQVLSDPEKRRLYDRFGPDGPKRAGFGGFGNVEDIFSSFGDIFGDIFGGGGFGGFRQRRPRGADLETVLELTFEEAIQGCRKEVQVRRHTTCSKCSGTGAAPGTAPTTCATCGGKGQVVHSQGFFMVSTGCPNCGGHGVIIKNPCTACRGTGVGEADASLSVTVPGGVEDGQTLRLGGKGDIAPSGGTPGNLYVHLQVKPHPQLQREGPNLFVEIALPLTTAALGGTVSVPVLSGEKELDVKRGTQPGEVVVLKGAGAPRLDGAGKGDQVVRFTVKIPEEISPRAEELLRELSTELGDETATGEKSGIFDRLQRGVRRATQR